MKHLIVLIAMVISTLSMSFIYGQSSLKIYGSPDDWVTQGETFISSSSTQFDKRNSHDNDALTLQVYNPGGDWYNLNFFTNDNRRLHVGSFTAQRYPFQDPGYAGIDIYGNHRGCNIIEGNFTIHKVVYSNNELVYIRVSFSQNCEGDPNENLHGTLVYDPYLIEDTWGDINPHNPDNRLP